MATASVTGTTRPLYRHDNRSETLHALFFIHDCDSVLLSGRFMVLVPLGGAVH